MGEPEPGGRADARRRPRAGDSFPGAPAARGAFRPDLLERRRGPPQVPEKPFPASRGPPGAQARAGALDRRHSRPDWGYSL
jgi:hypothetical protein